MIIYYYFLKLFPGSFTLFEDITWAEGLFDSTLLYRYEFPSFFPPQTLIIVSYGRDIPDMMIMMTKIKIWIV